MHKRSCFGEWNSPNSAGRAISAKSLFGEIGPPFPAKRSDFCEIAAFSAESSDFCEIAKLSDSAPFLPLFLRKVAFSAEISKNAVFCYFMCRYTWNDKNRKLLLKNVNVCRVFCTFLEKFVFLRLFRTNSAAGAEICDFCFLAKYLYLFVLFCEISHKMGLWPIFCFLARKCYYS